MIFSRKLCASSHWKVTSVTTPIIPKLTYRTERGTGESTSLKLGEKGFTRAALKRLGSDEALTEMSCSVR